VPRKCLILTKLLGAFESNAYIYAFLVLGRFLVLLTFLPKRSCFLFRSLRAQSLGRTS